MVGAGKGEKIVASSEQVLGADTEQSALFILTVQSCTWSLNKHLVRTYYVPGSEDFMEHNTELNSAPLELIV